MTKSTVRDRQSFPILSGSHFLHIMIIYMRKHFSRKPKLSKLPWRLTLKNFRVSFYFLDPWRDFHKISFTHAIWSSITLRDENHIHYVVYLAWPFTILQNDNITISWDFLRLTAPGAMPGHLGTVSLKKISWYRNIIIL